MHQWFPKPPTQYGELKNQLAGGMNLVFCEAHCDMLRENYRILNYGEEDIAKEYSEKVVELSKMPL